MSIDKSLYSLPQGLDTATPDLEIEIENPDAVHMNIDGMEIDFDPKDDTSSDFGDNLAEKVSDGELESLAQEIIQYVDEDTTSRREWIKQYVEGIELLGLKMEERTEPWDGACGVYHPMLTEAIVKFQAETMMATFPASGPVKTHVVGLDTPDTQAAAERVQDDMNYQLMDVMVEYRPEHERMLFGLAMSGNAFKKIYYDAHLGRQTAVYVPAEDLIVPYGASNLETAERVTHVMRKTENELRRLQVAGFYRDIDLGAPSVSLDEIEKKIAEKMGFSASHDDRYRILETQIDLDLPGFEHEDDEGKTGIALPYIVTTEKGSGKILSIRRNWVEGDKKYARRQHFSHYMYVPGFGFYALGLVHLIGGFAKSSTSLMRQLVDAGTLSNLPGGLKSRGMRVKGDDTPIAPGEFRDVDIAGANIRDSIMMLPYKEPSQTLFMLLEKIIEDGQRFSNSADLQVSDMSGEAPVGTTLAILERTLKVTSAIQSRIHYSMKQELGLLKKIIADYTPEDYDYEPVEGSRKAKRDDYDMATVVPVSDPNAATMAQKITQYQAVLQLSQQAPTIYNIPLLHRQMLDVLGIQNAAKLVQLPEDQVPTDPVSENQNILMMKPVKAFEYQDHQSHIAVHMSAMQDPKIGQLLQNNPQAPIIQAAMMAHINEHLGFEYRRQIEQQLGMTLPPQTDAQGNSAPMDPQVEARLSPLLAQAAQRLLQGNQQQAQQQQIQQQQQDPLVQMQQQELQLRQQEMQLKQQKQQMEGQQKQQQLALEKLRIDNQKSIADRQQKITAATALANTSNNRKANIIKTTSDLIKHNSEMQQQNIDRKIGIAKHVTETHQKAMQHKEDMISDGKKAIMQEETKHKALNKPELVKKDKSE